MLLQENIFVVGPHGGKMDSVKVDSFTGDLQASCHSGTEWRSLLAYCSLLRVTWDRERYNSRQNLQVSMS